jgi:hypothetical protein
MAQARTAMLRTAMLRMPIMRTAPPRRVELRMRLQHQTLAHPEGSHSSNDVIDQRFGVSSQR